MSNIVPTGRFYDMKGSTTKDNIIQKAAELFNTYGYHACSLTHIMEATELKKGGIYNHFKNKDEIAVEAFNYNYDRVLKRFRDRLDVVEKPTEKLFAVIDVFVSFVDDPMVKGGGCPIFNTAMDSTNTHPALKLKAKEGIKGLKKYIEIKLKEGVEAGEFKDGINFREVSTLIVATLEGAIIMSRVDDNNVCLDFASKYLKDYIDENIVNHPVNPSLQRRGKSRFGVIEEELDRDNKGNHHTLSTKIHNRSVLKERRKELRNSMTSAEVALWKCLKRNQLKGRKFRRKHSIKNYIVDFYCPSEKLVIELDGAVHYTPSGDREDFIRDEELNRLGIKVLRFENKEVFRNIEGVLNEISKSFK